MAWPKDNPGGWSHDAAAFLARLEGAPGMWHFLGRAKYLELRVDTRDGGFTLRDRDGELIDTNEVLAAADRAVERYGKQK